MNISEAEKATGLKRANIRFYEKCGLLSVSRNNANNYREYSDGDIQNLLKIKLLRCAGFTLEEIKKRNMGSRKAPVFLYICNKAAS